MSTRYRREIFLIIGVVLLGAFWARASYIPPHHDLHIDASEKKYDFDVGAQSKWFSAWSIGDGQAYMLIALDPSGGKLAEEIPEAGYRFARAGYSWAAYPVSLGRSGLAPPALAIVGALAVIGVLWASVTLRPSLGPRAWLLAANPALYLGFAGDTSEPMGIAMLVLAMGWSSWVGAMVLGVTRPTYLVSVWGQWRLFLPGVAAVGAVASYSLVMFGADAMVPSGGRIGPPLVAYVQHSGIWGLALLGCATATIVLGARRRDWAWVLAGFFVLCFGDDVLRDPVNAWRAAGFLPVLWAFGPGYEPVVARSPRGDSAPAAR